MVLTDHINLMGLNPLRGPQHKGLPRFVDLTRVYDPNLSGLLFKAGQACKAKLQRGVYLAVSGPSYETPSEIRAFAALGADAVGMSTVPEAIQLMAAASTVLDDSSVTSQIKRIRAKFAAHDPGFAAIDTVYGMGYRWLESDGG
jgi:purine-nucleoside phosphorylase